MEGALVFFGEMCSVALLEFATMAAVLGYHCALDLNGVLSIIWNVLILG